MMYFGHGLDSFEENIKNFHDSIALVYEETLSITYKELNDRANSLASYLIKKGLKREDVVALILNKSPEMIIAIIAVLKIGAAYLPINVKTPDDFKKSIFNDSKPVLVLSTSDLVNTKDILQSKIVFLDEFFSSYKISRIDNSMLCRAHPDGLACILYTSGSTGKQKGVCFSVRNISELIKGLWKIHNFNHSDVGMFRHSYSFAMSITEIFSILEFGGKLVITDDSIMSYEDFLNLLRKHHVTVSYLIPIELSNIISTFNHNDFDVFLRVVIMGGEKLDHSYAIKWNSFCRKCFLSDAYGLSEVSGPITNNFVVDSQTQIKNILHGSFIKILSENMDEASSGEIGEVYIYGSRLTRGYLNRPDLTAEKFIANPLGNGDRIYKTGDLGKLLQDGSIKFLGRADSQVKIRGFRIELGEIENTICLCNEVKTSIVLTIGDSDDKFLIAFIVPYMCNLEVWKQLITQTEERVTVFRGLSALNIVNDVYTKISSSLPDYMHPKHFVILDKIPLTPNGKANVPFLLSLYNFSIGLSESDNAAPRNDLESILCDIWSDVLHIAEIGIFDNFFKIGGNSLSATKVNYRIKSELNIDIEVKSIFEHPTIADLASILENKSPERTIFKLESQPKEKYSPLSFSQERLLVIDKLITQKSLYNIQFMLYMHGDINYHALEKSINFLICRHSALCTNFIENDNGCVYQSVSKKKYILEICDVNENEIDKIFLLESKREFDLRNDHLIRIKLLRISKGNHILLVTMHHIISDGWSVGIFLNELIDVYSSYSTNRGVSFSPLDIDYRDYSLWHKDLLQSGFLEKQIEYWKDHLCNLPHESTFPSDFYRPSEIHYDGDSYSFNIPAQIHQSVLGASVSENVSVFMVLFATVNCLLYKYAKQKDIIIGIPSANRNSEKLENIIGFFVNTLAIKTNFEDNFTFKDILREVKEAILNGYRNQDVPFEYVVSSLDIKRSLNKNPIFQVMVTSDSDNYNFKLSDGLEINYSRYFQKSSMFDMSFNFIEKCGKLECVIEYSTELFGKKFIKQIASQFLTFLESSLNKISISIDEIDIISEQERYNLLIELNQSDEKYPSGKLAQNLFEEQAKNTPDRIAITHNDIHISYDELNKRANQLALFLKNYGTNLGDVIAISMDKSIYVLISILGIWKAGATYVPIDPNYPDDRKKYMLSDSGSIMLLISDDATLTDVVEIAVFNICKIHENKKGEHYIQGSCLLEINSDSQNLAYIIYTSGSTGIPKGVQISHESIFARIFGLKSTYSVSSEDRWLNYSSFSFDASLEEMILPLSFGATTVIAQGQNMDIENIRENVYRYEISAINFVPTFFDLFLESIMECKYDFHLKKIIIGGEALPKETLEKSNKCHSLQNQISIINTYGPTETTIDATSVQCLNTCDKISIGRPVSNTKIYILDKYLNLAPKGTFGEIYISGKCLSRGYLNNQSLTAEKFIANPFGNGDRIYKSGDIGRYLSNGNIEFLGRTDRQVKIRGFRIELGEIENVIDKIDAVSKSVIMAQSPDAEGDTSSDMVYENNSQKLIAYIIPKEIPNNKEIINTIIDQNNIEINVFYGNETSAILEKTYFLLEGNLPNYMIPDNFVVLNSIPFTINGKIDDKLLSSIKVKRKIIEYGYTPPSNDMEHAMCKIWQDVLGVEKIGIHDAFFRIGGNSLLATRVIARIREVTGKEIQLKYMFQYPTISEFAKVILTIGTSNVIPHLNKQARPNNIPLSFTQQRLWTLYKLLPNKSLYNIPFAVSLSGCLSYEALENAINHIIQKHEILRTTFVEKIDVYQIIENWDFTLSIEYIDDANISAILSHESLKPFDLKNDRLIRVKLFRISENDHVLMVNMHHIISDGWSIGIFWNELIKNYSTYLKQENVVEYQEIQYVDYAIWQRMWLNKSALEKQITYWRKYLIGAPVSTELPFDYQRPSEMKYTGSKYSLHIPQEVYELLQNIVVATDTTVFMVIFAAINCLLQRYTHQNDIITGITEANRRYKETESIIGFFVNTLPIRVRFEKKFVFTDILYQVKQSFLSAHENQDIPFDYLVDQLKIDRHININPLFQVLITANDENISDVFTDQIECTKLNIDFAVSKFDLVFNIVEKRNALTIDIEYSTELFKKDSIERLASCLSTLLCNLLQNQNTPLIMLDMLSSEEKKQQLLDWNDTQQDFIDDICIHELFEKYVFDIPDAVVAVQKDKIITYNELNIRANKLAHYLRKCIVKLDKLVGICVEQSSDFLIGILAILKAGGAYVPLDPNYPDDRLKYMLENAKIEILLTQKLLKEKLKKVFVGKIETVYIDDENKFIQESSENLISITNPLNLAYVIYTSGSTGYPKGVQVSHIGVVNFALSKGEHLSVTKGSKVSQIASFSFDASVSEIVKGILRGGELVFIDAKGNFQEDMNNYLINTSVMLASLLKSNEVIINSLETLIVAGEPLNADILNRYSHINNFINSYGPTECTICSSTYNLKNIGMFATIGRPISNAKIYILDENLNLVPIGVAGEIYIGGVGLARGYLNNPTLTAERFVANPFGNGDRIYNSGDIARYLSDGNIEFLSRTDNQIKIRGFRIELGEIESKISSVESVKTAVVLARENENGCRQLIAYIIPKIQDELKELYRIKSATNLDISVYIGDVANSLIEKIHSKISEQLPNYMIPNYFVILSGIPLTPNNKTDTKLLFNIDINKTFSEQEYVSPTNEIEFFLCKLWEEVLRIDKVSINDNFFKIGGDSIIAIQIASKAKQKGFSFTVRNLFENQSIAELSKVVSNATEEYWEFEVDEYSDLEEKLREHVKSIISDEQNFDTVYYLSPTQKGILFQTIYNENSDVYFVQDVFQVSKIEFDIFRRAFNYVANQYDILRAGFLWKNLEESVCYVRKSIDVPFFYIDISGYNKDEQNAKLDIILQEDRAKRFDFSTPPLMRVNVIKFSEDIFTILFSFHHLLLDGWSTAVFQEEVFYVYECFINGIEPTLKKRKQFHDYIKWIYQQNIVTSKQFWMNYLSPIESQSLLSFDNFIDNEKFNKEIEFAFSVNESVNMQNFCKNNSITLNTLLLGSLGIVVSKYLNQNNVIIGFVSSGRGITLSEIEDIIGLFISSIPVKMNVTGNIAAYLQKLQRDIQLLNENAFASLADIHTWSNVEKLFNILFIYENYPTHKKSNIKTVHVKTVEKTEYPLTITCHFDDDRVKIRYVFDPKSFNENTLSQLGKNLKNVLQQIVNGSTSILEEIEVVSEKEKEKLLVEWNSTEKKHKNEYIHELFEYQAQKNPDAIVAIYKNQHITYEELNYRSNKLAKKLREISLAIPETSVGIYFYRSIEIIIAMMGILKSGSTYIPLDPMYPTDRLKNIIADSDMRVILTYNFLAEKAKEIIDNNTEIIFVDNYNGYMEYSSENLKNISQPNNLVYIMFTSGSTGKPKGVMISHSGFANRINWMVEKYNFSSKNRILQKTATSFDLSGWELFAPLTCGATVVFLDADDKNHERVMHSINKYLIDVVNFVPSQLKIFLDSNNNTDINSLKLIISGGETLSYDLYRRVFQDFGLSIQNGYGPTEVTLDGTYYCKNDGVIYHTESTPVGKPISNMKALILDNSFGLVPINGIGEIYISGVGLARGYLNRPDLTAEKFVANPFGTGDRIYRTGDLGRFLFDGNIEHLGRIDNQVKIRGFRIELGEIESEINKCGNVLKNIVLAKTDAEGNKHLVAYIIPKDLIDFEELHNPETATKDSIKLFGGEKGNTLIESIRNEISKTLPEYMIPSYFVIIDKISLMPNGKTDNKILLNLETGGRIITDEYVAPRNTLEQQLCEIWREVLHLDKVGINDNFFKIGGNSINVIKIINKIHTIYGVEIKISEFFLNPHINSIADLILFKKESDKEEYTPLVKLNTNTNGPCVFMVHPGTGGCEAYFSLSTFLEKKFCCYGIDSYNLYNANKILSIRELAEMYVSCIEPVMKQKGQKNYYIIGWSLGGQIALEMATILEKNEDININLLLLDTIILDDNLISIFNLKDKSSLLMFKEEFEKKLTLSGYENDHIQKYMNLVEIENEIALQKTTSILNRTFICLFKALHSSGNHSEASEYIRSLKCNNIEKIITSQDLLNIKCFEADHRNVLFSLEESILLELEGLLDD